MSCARRLDALQSTPYAPDHQNYHCLNYTRPVPLPCAAASDKYRPRWFKGRRRRFIVYAWWPPNPLDFEAYADAGFNLALTENSLGAYCARKGVNASVTHDDLFEAILEASDALARLGLMTVFNTGNMCNRQLERSKSQAYGNATGGLIFGHANLTARAQPGPNWRVQSKALSKGQSVPELRWLTTELARRGKLDQFAGIQMHDDTIVQTGREIEGAAWLQANAPTFIPLVNQVSGTSGPQSLYRSGYFISAPEQYPIRCPHGNCTAASGVNATRLAQQQMANFAGNALVDERFGLDSWPLFHVGDKQPDAKSNNVRSDSLLRWMAYSAIAYGATGLNYYCWGGGLWFHNNDPNKPGKPTSMYATAREVNADAIAWGDELLGNGFGFVGALHTGFVNEHDGGGSPSPSSIVTSMSDDLLVGIFLPRGDSDVAVESLSNSGRTDAPAAYLFVVDKRVGGQLARMPARNVTLRLHQSVGRAAVASPGQFGAGGFPELRSKYPNAAPRRGNAPRRVQYAHVVDRDLRGQLAEATVEVVGGGGALIRLYAAPAVGATSALVDASYAKVTWTYSQGSASLLNVKAPEWAYDSWHAAYRPYATLETTAGRSFEDGEQTNFIIGGSFAGAAPPTAADEAKAWAWAGFNLLSMSAPPADDLAAYGPISEAIGATLDFGYSFGFFGMVEPSEYPDHEAQASSRRKVMRPSEVLSINSAFRCHGRWAGMLLGVNLTTAPEEVGAALAATAAFRRSGRWLLPMASTQTANASLTLGRHGLAFAMPAVPRFTAFARAPAAAQGSNVVDEAASLPLATNTAEAWAQEVAALYDPFRRLLSASYVPSQTTPGAWDLKAPMPFAASLDACATESDSLLRFSAFAALAYGARGLFWRGAGSCAPVGSAKFALLASINTRIAQWGNTFVASTHRSDFPGGGYNITELYSTGYALPGTVPPGRAGERDLVQSADPDVLIARLGDQGRPTGTGPLLYVVDKRVSAVPGSAGVRTVRVTLHEAVTATQPVEGDCVAAHCQCGLGLLGNVLTVKLPGGSGQLVALAMGPSDKGQPLP